MKKEVVIATLVVKLSNNIAFKRTNSHLKSRAVNLPFLFNLMTWYADNDIIENN